MTFDWQDIVALIVVVSATGYLIRRIWSAARGRGGCTSCAGGCSSKDAAGDIVSVESLIDSSRVSAKHGDLT